MTPQEENHILIDRYLKNQLSQAEREAFEQKCGTDPDFAKEVKLHTKAEFMVRSDTRSQRKEKFNQEFDRLQLEKPIISFFKKRSFIITSAAAIIALIFLFFWGNIFSPSYSSDELFAQNFAPLEITNDRVIDSSINMPVNETWAKAVNFYIKKDFEEVIPLIAEVLESEEFTNKPKARLYLGLSYMQAFQKAEVQNSAKEIYLTHAIEQFEQISVESTFIERANWYRALAYLKLGDREVAASILRKIVAYDYHYKSEAAQEILDNL